MLRLEKFEFKMILTQLTQKNKENIIDYLKKIAELSRKLFNDDIDINVTILKKLRKQSKRNQINFVCNKNSNYIFLR